MGLLVILKVFVLFSKRLLKYIYILLLQQGKYIELVSRASGTPHSRATLLGVWPQVVFCSLHT